MEGFLVHTADADLNNAIVALGKHGEPIRLSPTLFAIRTGLPAQELMKLISSAVPAGSNVLVARTNGALSLGDELMSSAAKLLG